MLGTLVNLTILVAVRKPILQYGEIQMTNLKFFLGLVRMLADASDELGLTGLTETDRTIYMLLWEAADKSSRQLEVRYEEFVDAVSGPGVKFSRAQFYKTLKKLEELKLIERVGSPRSARYHLLGEV